MACKEQPLTSLGSVNNIRAIYIPISFQHTKKQIARVFHENILSLIVLQTDKVWRGELSREWIKSG